jgi:hypothetical protein
MAARRTRQAVVKPALRGGVVLLAGLPWAGAAFGQAPCAAGEQALFACSTGSKRVAVCASPDLGAASGSVQYRFGRPGAVELATPADAGDWRATTRGGTLALSGGGGAYLSFARPPYRYVVYTAIGRGWGSKAGVVVEQNGRRIAHLRCRDEPASSLGPELFMQAGIADDAAGFELP